MNNKNKINISRSTDLLNFYSITPPHIQLCGEQQKESCRKEKDIWYKIKSRYPVLIEKISSLLSVDYYESNKKNQFKDIQLQLHASTVSNPYTFSIQGNKSFSGICVEALPSTETYLYNKYAYTYEQIFETIKISIPPNCRVLKVATKVHVFVENVNEGNFGYVDSTIINTSNNITWIDEHEDTGVYNEEANIDVVKYIGVTPNKTYTLSLDLDASADYETAEEEIICQISYSSDINSHSVDIKDY